MTLRDEELRTLAEIEREFLRTDPRFHRLFTTRRRLPPGSTALILSSLAMHVAGLVIAVAGVASAGAVLIGTAIAVGFPTMAIWHVWLRR